MTDNNKRKVSEDQYSIVKKRVRTSFEQISNEIIYEIFDYLEGCQIHQAFSDLNLRFQQLITSPILLLKLSLDGKSCESLQLICEKILRSNRKQICSFQLKNCRYFNGILTDFLSYSSFTHLQSLSLLDITLIRFENSFSSIQSLAHLISLHIHLTDDDGEDELEIGNFYENILNLSSLKYLQVFILFEESSFNIHLPQPKTEQFSSIETLALSHVCDMHEILSLLGFTPQIRRLTCQTLIDHGTDIDFSVSISVPNLISFTINECEVEFSVFEKFLQKISKYLQKFRIDNYETILFIYPKQWEQLITHHLPNLNILKLKCNLYKYNILKSHHFPTFHHSSTSQFYSVHQWIFQLQIKPNQIVYTLSTKHSISLIKPSLSCIDLAIIYSHTIAWRQSFLDLIRPILLSIPFFSLNLFWIGFYGDRFIQLIHLLPNLQILKLLTSIHFPQGSVPIADAYRFRSNNQLIRLSLSNAPDMEYLNFLTIFFSYLTYLEVNNIKQIYLQTLLGFILKRLSTHLNSLRTIRLQIIDVNDQVRSQLKRFISKEKLLSKYSIERIDDTILLKW